MSGDFRISQRAINMTISKVQPDAGLEPPAIIVPISHGAQVNK